MVPMSMRPVNYGSDRGLQAKALQVAEAIQTIYVGLGKVVFKRGKSSNGSLAWSTNKYSQTPCTAWTQRTRAWSEVEPSSHNEYQYCM